MSGFPDGLGRTPMPRGGKNMARSFPEITHTSTAFIDHRNAPPQLATGLFTTIPNGKSDNLSSQPTQRSPQPPLLFPRPHKTPHFIQLQLITRSRWQRVLEDGPLRRFFLTSPPAFAAPPQRSAQSPACRAARSRPPKSALVAPRCPACWDLRPRSTHGLYPNIFLSRRLTPVPQCRASDSGDNDG
jgi:hypothetical protein